MIKILTSVVNNPIFIEIQYYTLKTYMQNEYEFIIFNDAKNFPDFTNGYDITIKQQITDLCEKLDIKCINIENNYHKNMKINDRHADVFNKCILKYQKENPSKYLLLDSDMFLIDYFNINEYSEHNCAIVLQSRNNNITNYMWPGLCYIDFTKIDNIELLDWSCITAALETPIPDEPEGCDCGGKMKYWLKTQTTEFPICDNIRHSEYNTFNKDNIYYIKHLWSLSWDESEYPENIKIPHLLDLLKRDTRNKNGKFFCEIYDKKFLHYRAGSNWNNEGMNFHNSFSLALKNIIINKT